MVNRLVLVAKLSGRVLASLSRGIAALPSLLFGMVMLFALVSGACWYFGFNSSDFVAAWLNQKLFDSQQDQQPSLVSELGQMLTGGALRPSAGSGSSSSPNSNSEQASDLAMFAPEPGKVWVDASGKVQPAVNIYQSQPESQSLYDQDLAAAIENNRQALAAKAQAAPAAAAAAAAAASTATQDGVSTGLKQRFAFLDSNAHANANASNSVPQLTEPTGPTEPTEDSSLQRASSHTALEQQINQGLAQVSQLHQSQLSWNSAGVQVLEILDPDFMEQPQGRITNLVVNYQDEESMSWLGLGSQQSAFTKEFIAPTCNELMWSDSSIMTYQQAEMQLKLIKEHLCSKGVCEQAYADNPALYDKLLKQAFRLWFDDYYPQKKKALANRQRLDDVKLRMFFPAFQSLTRETMQAFTDMRQNMLEVQAAEPVYLVQASASTETANHLGGYLQAQLQGDLSSGASGSLRVESLQPAQPTEPAALLATEQTSTVPESLPSSQSLQGSPAVTQPSASGNPWLTVSDYGASEKGFQILGNAEAQPEAVGTAIEHARADAQGRHALGANQSKTKTELSKTGLSKTEVASGGGAQSARHNHAAAVDLQKMDTILWPFAPSEPFKRSSLGIGGAPPAPQVDPDQKLKSTLRTDWEA